MVMLPIAIQEVGTAVGEAGKKQKMIIQTQSNANLIRIGLTISHKLIFFFKSPTIKLWTLRATMSTTARKAYKRDNRC